MTFPSGECKAGYYCPTGSKKAEAVDCPIGFHCPTGINTFKYHRNYIIIVNRCGVTAARTKLKVKRTPRNTFKI